MTLETRITKTFGSGFRLDVDFKTGGGVLGLLGPSGSGKSMTLKCIAGIEKPDSGRIVLNNRVLYDSNANVDLPAQLRRAGYLFQSYALFPRMSAAENIASGIPGTASEKTAAVARWIKRLRLDGLERHLPHQLSGGQQQRVALARMLAAQPEIVLLDEPFSALDAHLREEMQSLFREMLKDHDDALMVSHDRNEINRLCDQTLTLSNGEIISRSSP